MRLKTRLEGCQKFKIISIEYKRKFVTVYRSLPSIFSLDNSILVQYCPGRIAIMSGTLSTVEIHMTSPSMNPANSVKNTTLAVMWGQNIEIVQ